MKRRCKRPPLRTARSGGKANPTWSKIKYDAGKATRLYPDPDLSESRDGISIGLIATSPGRRRPGKINDHRAGLACSRRRPSADGLWRAGLPAHKIRLIAWPPEIHCAEVHSSRVHGLRSRMPNVSRTWDDFRYSIAYSWASQEGLFDPKPLNR